MKKTLFKEKNSEIENFNNVFRTAVDRVNQITLPTLKKYNKGLPEDLDELQDLLSEPYRITGTIKNDEQRNDLDHALKCVGWQRKFLVDPLVYLEDGILKTDENEIEEYIENHFRVYDTGQREKAEIVMQSLCNVLNEARKYYNLDNLELPLCIGFNPSAGYHFRKQHLDRQIQIQ